MRELFHHAGFRLNVTPSVPVGIYRVTTDPTDYVTFCLSSSRDEPAQRYFTRLAIERDYLPPGTCPNGFMPLFKRIVARPGDQVSAATEGIRVNGFLLPHTAPLLFDTRHRPLCRIVTAPSYCLKPGKFWVASSDDVHSFDSRYYGPINESQILEHMRPVYVW
jgi:conjugative transfer signal peptidase TraF